MVSVKNEVDRVVVRIHPWLARFVFLLLLAGAFMMSDQVVRYATQRFSVAPYMTVQSPLIVQRRNFRPGEVVTVRADSHVRVGGTLTTELRLQNMDTGETRRVDFPTVEVIPGDSETGLAALWVIDADQPEGRYRFVAKSTLATTYGEQRFDWWTTDFYILPPLGG